MVEGCYQSTKREDYLNETELDAVRKYEAAAKREYRKRCRLQIEPEISEVGDIESMKRKSYEDRVKKILMELKPYGKDDRTDIIEQVLNNEKILPYTHDKTTNVSLVVSTVKNSLQVLKTPRSHDELF